MGKKDVFISAVNYNLPDRFDAVIVSENYNKKIDVGHLIPNKNSDYYPARSDEKIMRTDVVVAIIGILEMLNELGITEEERSDMSLFVANSIFIEENNKNMKRALSVLSKLKDFDSVEQKLHTIYRNTPPLLALETLTNAAMSFISQYTGIKGANTTFGSTSHSGFDALEAACSYLQNYDTKVLVGGSNCSGIYSFLTYQNFYSVTDEWKESACSSFLVLGNRGKVKITKVHHNYNLPSLKSGNVVRNWQGLLDGFDTEFIVYSNGFIRSDFIDNENEVKEICDNYFSWENEFGNFGASSIYMSIAYGYGLIEKGKNEVVDILNRDVYGRESHIRIEKA